MNPNRVTNTAQPFFTFGAWHHYEVVLVLNDIGSANGVYSLWWDGELVAHYTDVVFRDSAHPSGFYGRAQPKHQDARSKPRVDLGLRCRDATTSKRNS